MKLYRVHVDRVLYVLADDAFHAERKGVFADPNPDETEITVEPATENGVEADGWTNCPPYGQPDEGAGKQLLAGDLVRKLNTQAD